MKYKHVYALFLMFVFHSSCGQSQTNPPQDNIKSETKDVITSHGPSSIVRTIIQDRKGNIWMASWEGIIRYDGKSFTNITSKVTSARFFSVLEDRKGNFWFGTVGSGVYYYDGKSFQHFTSSDNGLFITKDKLANDVVIDIYEDKIGNIWFGTGGGVSRYDGKSFRNFTTKDGLTNNDVNTIMEDKTGKLWIGTRGDACTFDGKTFTTLTNKDGKAFKNVWSIIEDRKGNIWLSEDSGFWRYNGTTYTNFNQNFGGYIYEDKIGNIWTSSRTAMYNTPCTLSRYDEKSLNNKKPTVTEITTKQMIFGILEDYDGNIWFGSGDGVYRYDGKTFTDFKSAAGQK